MIWNEFFGMKIAFILKKYRKLDNLCLSAKTVDPRISYRYWNMVLFFSDVHRIARIVPGLAWLPVPNVWKISDLRMTNAFSRLKPTTALKVIHDWDISILSISDWLFQYLLIDWLVKKAYIWIWVYMRPCYT